MSEIWHFSAKYDAKGKICKMKAMNVKNRLANAFIELIKERETDGITVRDIAEKSGVSRQSFYYHFSDVYDMVSWIISSATEEYAKEMKRTTKPEEAAVMLLRGVYDRKEMIQCMLRGKDSLAIETVVYKATMEFLQRYFETHPVINIRTDMKMTLDFYGYAITGMLCGVCERDDVDLEYAAEQMGALISGNVFEDRV